MLDGDLVLGSSAHGHRGHSAHGRLEIVLGQGCHSAYNWRAVVGALLLFDAQLRVEPLGDHLDGVDHARVLHVVWVGRFTSEPLMRYEDNVIVAVRQIVKRIAIDELPGVAELLVALELAHLEKVGAAEEARDEAHAARRVDCPQRSLPVVLVALPPQLPDPSVEVEKDGGDEEYGDDGDDDRGGWELLGGRRRRRREGNRAGWSRGRRGHRNRSGRMERRESRRVGTPDGARVRADFIMTRLAVFGTFTAYSCHGHTTLLSINTTRAAASEASRPRPLPARPLRDAFAALE